MDEALVARVEQLDAAVGNVQQALLDLANKVFWLYNACDFLDREEAMAMIQMFNETFHLVEDLDVIDPQEFDELTPDMFKDVEPPDGD